MRPWMQSALLACALAAQTPAGWAQPKPQASPSPEALSLGRQVVEITNGNRDQTMSAMRAPLAGLVGQMGITDPVKAATLVNDAMLPVLNEHFDDLLTSQAANYAQVLSVADMQGVIAFYQTPAGRDLVAAQPALASARLTSLTQWLQSFRPELTAKVQEVAQAHGWVGQQ